MVRIDCGSFVACWRYHFVPSPVSGIFLSAWTAYRCGHCKELAPKWDQMAKEWESNEDVVVASVDCTAGTHEAWCLSLGIQAFPTIQYGTPPAACFETYHGDKTYEALSEFANETLNKPVCSPCYPDLCDEPAKRKINEIWRLSKEGLEASILDNEKLIEKEENNFKQKFQEMQAAYDKQSQEHEFQLAKLKSNIRLLKSFLEKK